MTFADLQLAPTPAAYLKAARAIDASQVEGLRPLRIAVLATFTAEFLRPYLTVEGAARGFAFTTWFGPWGQLEEQALDDASELYAQQPDAVVILARMEDLAPAAVERLGGVIAGLRRRTSEPLFVANFVEPLHRAAGLAGTAIEHSRANEALAAACRAHADVHVLDLARTALEHGLNAWTDPKLFALARVAFSVTAQIAVAKRLARTIRAAFVPPAKVLALDLDNTLWGGVLGEDGLGGIALGDEYPGSVFKAWQKYLCSLKDRGVLLAIASKNNESDVLELFAKHRDMVLRREDFAAVRINWQEKSTQLTELAAELNLGLDAFVFLDDSPFEREEVRRHLPMVHVPEFPASPLGLIAAVEDSELFDRLTLSAEDRQRAGIYQQQTARVAAEKTAESSEDFLMSLQLTARIGAVDGDTLPRVAQLLGKTNQFNLTTRRHSAAEIAAMIEGGAVALWLRLADRFGDHGLVGAAIATGDGAEWRVDTFLLSCRVIGRGAETALLAQLAAAAQARGAGALTGEYLPTAKNALVADFYPKQGFQPCGEGRWRLDLTSHRIAPPAHIAIQTP